MRISIEAFRGDPEDITTDNLASSFIKSLLEILSEIPAEQQENAAIEFSSGGEDYAIMEITYFREETTAELSAITSRRARRLIEVLEISRKNVILYEQELKELIGGDK